MRPLAFVFFAFGGSLFVSSGYYRLHHGERIPPKGWFRFCNEMLRRRRYADSRGPAAQLLPPRLSIVAGLLAIVAGVSLLFGPWYS
jgi:hypothetical protein